MGEPDPAAQRVKTLRALVRGLHEGAQPLPPETARYLLRVHRLVDGDAFVGFDGEGREARCVLRFDGESPVAEAQTLTPSAARREVVWIQALGKGDKTDAVVRDATELSATRIVLVTTERTIPKLGDKAAQRLARWRTIAEEAARQSLRADVPDVEGPLSLDEALRAHAAELSVLLHPGATTRLRPLLDAHPTGASVAFAVGPEGGFSPAEVALAETRSFHPATLGPVVLRTETAAAAVLGALVVLG